MVRHLTEMVDSAPDGEAKEKAVDRLQARKDDLVARHGEQAKNYSCYQELLREWEQSPLLREARQWLTSALLDLEKRGLIQCDRQTGLFDLHPVVRGFAVGSLSAEARDEAGKKVADYFSTRPDQPYDKAGSLRELSNTLCVIKVLNMAGRNAAAYTTFTWDLHCALIRLDMGHEILALMHPLFPLGWGASPSGVTDNGRAAKRAGDALYRVGQFPFAAIQHQIAVDAAIRGKEPKLLSGRLSDLWDDLRAMEKRALAARVLDLAGTCARRFGTQADQIDITRCRILDLIEMGDINEASNLWKNALSLKGDLSRDHDSRYNAYISAHVRLHENAELDTGLLTAINECKEQADQIGVRLLLAVLSDFYYRDERYDLALETVEEAISRARAAGIRSLYTMEYEGQRACCLAMLGRRGEALSAAESAAVSSAPPHPELANAFLELGEPEKALHHALEGYRKAWADGLPFSNVIDLEQCRTVFQALSYPEPRLEPFDLAKVGTLSFETELEALLQKQLDGSQTAG